MWTHRCPDCLNACDCPGDAEHCSHACDGEDRRERCPECDALVVYGDSHDSECSRA